MWQPPLRHRCFDSNGSLADAATAVLREARFPAIPALAGAEWRGTPLLTRRESRLAANRLFLLGDAAGYAEPFTGEGMTWAVLDRLRRAAAGATGMARLAAGIGLGVDGDLPENDWPAAHGLPGNRGTVAKSRSRSAA